MASKNSSKPNKLVRDSFTIPKVEYATIDALKTRAIGMGSSVKKSELLRAGLMVLKRLSDGDFKTAIAAVPTLKTGRPSAEAASPKAVTVAKPAVAAKTAVKAAVKAAAKPAAKAKPVAKAAPKPVEKKVVAKKAATPAPRKPAAKAVAPKPKAAAPVKAAVAAKPAVPAVKPAAAATTAA